MPSFVYTALALAVIFGLWMVVEKRLQARRRARAPRITGEEFDSFLKRLAKATLPVAWVTLSPALAPVRAASRIGGRPYIDSNRQKWPVRDKVPMLFLGQINFAEVPPLPDFPTQGLLQIFVLANARGDIESTELKTDRVIRWFPDPQGTLTLDPPEALTRHQKCRTFSPRVIRDGLAITFEAAEMTANPDNWPYAESYPNLDKRLPESDAVRQSIEAMQRENEARYDALDGRSWIGGHPQFVQNDVREEPRLHKLNRVLLHLASDVKDICLGDTGELNMMISAKDLHAADYDKAYCTWDCS